MGDVRLDYAVPSVDLAPYVSLFYWFRTDAAEFEDIERAARAQFRFRLSAGPADYLFPDGLRQDAPAAHVLGATCGVIHTRAAGPVRVFGMGLTPCGWAALLGTDASAMLNRVVDAETLFGQQVGETLVALKAAPTLDDKVAVAERAVRVLIAGRDDRGATLGFVRAVDAWLAGSSSPELDTLIAETGLSRRQVERRCNALYGSPPKLLARKYRALRAAVAIASGAADALSLVDEGFYDQSHLIREVKTFTGLTPRRLRAEPGELSHLTITHRRALEGRVHPIISDT